MLERLSASHQSCSAHIRNFREDATQFGHSLRLAAKNSTSCLDLISQACTPRWVPPIGHYLRVLSRNLTKHCQDRDPSSRRRGHGQRASMDEDMSTAALISIFAPVRFAVLCQSAAEESLGASDALPCFLAICLRSGPSSFQLG